MSLNPLLWIRSQVKAAVLAGFSDALVVLDGTDNEQAAAQLTVRLTPLPKPEEEAPVAKRGKKE